MHLLGYKSMDESSLYVCGFNGFGQINHLCQSSQNDASNHMYYSSPQKSAVSHAVRVVSTWSKICVITGKGHLFVGGLKHKDDNMLYSHSDQVFPDIATTCDNFTIFKRTPEKLCLMAEGEITVQDLDITEAFQLKEVAGCDKELAVVSEDQHIYSGSLHQTVEGPVKLTMTLLCGSLKIQSVSCGKEHVLLLSYTGEVYSYGKGSRGQLGYGDLHVDRQTTPLSVETLSGLAVTGIAAGGWHSTAVTAEGDLYVWGWNESGQLGLTNGKQKSKDIDSTVMSALEKTSSDELQSVNNRSMNDNSEAKKQKFSSFGNSGCSVGAGDTDFDINEKQSFASNIKGHISTVCDEQSSSIKLHQQRMHFIYHQDTEPVQIQGVPQVLDLPEVVKVTKVSCGSRHTAVLLDNGCLMTTGWNGYGQLCHGDVTSRDFLQTVAFFTDQQLVVTNVFCDVWTTAIITQEITGH
ncbi:hypothetical protein ACJMK2_006299 [Sinanodonta woodiana]|uniref:Uncharacterized protein n=1 Tax=Sinanodonta woodiana TaxID=1069815 RepID=A0ABD3VSQ3_SINWO